MRTARAVFIDEPSGNMRIYRVRPAIPPHIRIRWRIFSLLFGFGFWPICQVRTITVAASMMPELH
jgi:hypothetical protein